MGKKLTQEEVVKQFKEVHGDKYLYDKVNYVNEKTNIWIGCKVEGHKYFEQTPNTHKKGSGCPKCANIKVGNKNSIPKGNSIKDLRPDLLQYLVNIEDGDTYAINSCSKVFIKCIKCGKEKDKPIRIDYLSTKGFSCDYCSDGISIPEKFGIYLLKQLDIQFETQKMFSWSNRKRYDFCLEVNNKKIILETHGGQHYEEISKHYLRTLKEEQENDLYKYNLAIENGIKPENYIVIDCRCSEFEWLKENYIKQLSHIFDLSNIDWDTIWVNCQHSIVIKVWDAWNNKRENDTTITIGKLFNLHSTTISRYLKRGNEVGKCIYDTKEEFKKICRKARLSNCRKTYQYCSNGIFINEFESTTNAGRSLGFNQSNISACCLGKSELYKGFKWSYNTPINGMYPD